METRADRPESAAGVEPVAQAHTFYPGVSGEGDLWEPLRFCHSDAGGLGRQLPFRAAHVRTAAQKIRRKPDRNSRRRRRHALKRGKFGYEFARWLTDQDCERIHGRPHRSFERRNHRLLRGKQGCFARDVKFSRDAALIAGAIEFRRFLLNLEVALSYP